MECVATAGVGGPVRRHLSLAELVRTLTNSDSKILTIPYEEAYEGGFEDMARRVPDLTKISNLVGYKPRVQLPEILSLVIDHYRGKHTKAV